MPFDSSGNWTGPAGQINVGSTAQPQYMSTNDYSRMSKTPDFNQLYPNAQPPSAANTIAAQPMNMAAFGLASPGVGLAPSAPPPPPQPSITQQQQLGAPQSYQQQSMLPQPPPQPQQYQPQYQQPQYQPNMVQQPQQSIEQQVNTGTPQSVSNFMNALQRVGAGGNNNFMNAQGQQGQGPQAGFQGFQQNGYAPQQLGYQGGYGPMQTQMNQVGNQASTGANSAVQNGASFGQANNGFQPGAVGTKYDVGSPQWMQSNGVVSQPVGNAAMNILANSMPQQLSGTYQDPGMPAYNNIVQNYQGDNAIGMDVGIIGGPNPNPGITAPWLASDERVKTNIQPANDIEEFVHALGAYSYEYKDPAKHGEGTYVSPMAQEFEQSKLGKEQVITAPDGTKMVNYNPRMVGLALAAIAHLNHKVEDGLEDKIIAAINKRLKGKR